MVVRVRENEKEDDTPQRKKLELKGVRKGREKGKRRKRIPMKLHKRYIKQYCETLGI